MEILPGDVILLLSEGVRVGIVIPCPKNHVYDKTTRGKVWARWWGFSPDGAWSDPLYASHHEIEKIGHFDKDLLEGFDFS